jgi:uncharacterized protein (TIGR01244 family)
MADLKMSRVTAQLTVSAQPRLEDFPALAAMGIRTVINNRPDGEEPGQPTAAAASELAAANGMKYRHIPVTLPDVSEADVMAFSQALAEADGPVHAHCRSGLRSVTLWALGEVAGGRLAADEARAAIAAAGYDPKAAKALLAKQRMGTPS